MIFLSNTKPGYLLNESILEFTLSAYAGNIQAIVAPDILLHCRYLHNSTRAQLLQPSYEPNRAARNTNEAGVDEPISLDPICAAVMNHPRSYFLLCNTWEYFPLNSPRFQTNLRLMLEEQSIPPERTIVSCCDACPTALTHRPTILAFGFDWAFLREKLNFDPMRVVASDAPKPKYFMFMFFHVFHVFHVMFLSRRYSDDRFLVLAAMSLTPALANSHYSFLSQPSRHDVLRIVDWLKLLDLSHLPPTDLARRIDGLAQNLPMELDGTKEEVD